MARLLDWVAAIPAAAKWALAVVCIVLGLLLILRTERVIRGMRRLLLSQLRLVRKPLYFRLIKVEGWGLFVGGTLLALLLVLLGERR